MYQMKDFGKLPDWLWQIECSLTFVWQPALHLELASDLVRATYRSIVSMDKLLKKQQLR